MALRRIGRYYHAYFVRYERNGVELRKKQVQRCLYTDDIDVARTLESKMMRDNLAASREARAGAKIEAILTNSTTRVVKSAPRRLKIENALEKISKYGRIGETAQKHWRRFARESGFVYMDEVTPDDAFSFLDDLNLNGKNFNNIKSALNGIYKKLLLESGMKESPFDRIPSRAVSSLPQRPYTHAEYARIFAVASSPWKEAVQIAWYTGLREKDVFTLKWDEISGDLIRRLPAKTARFRREVLIPIHPALQRILDALPRNGERVLGAWPYDPKSNEFRDSFGKILESAGIHEDGKATLCFNCLRNSFISRCDAAGIPRHAIRGIVGHVSDGMTDLYSHDETSARLIQSMPE